MSIGQTPNGTAPPNGALLCGNLPQKFHEKRGEGEEREKRGEKKRGEEREKRGKARREETGTTSRRTPKYPVICSPKRIPFRIARTTFESSIYYHNSVSGAEKDSVSVCGTEYCQGVHR